MLKCAESFRLQIGSLLLSSFSSSSPSNIHTGHYYTSPSVVLRYVEIRGTHQEVVQVMLSHRDTSCKR